MPTDDVIEVEVETATQGGVVEVDTATSAEAGKEKVVAQTDAPGVKELKAQLEEIKQRETRANADRLASEDRVRRQEAENRQITERLARLQTENEDNKADALASAIDAAKAEGDAAERDFRAANEQLDYARMAEAQRRLARAEARFDRLESQKAQQVAAPRLPEGRVVVEPARPTDPVEAEIANYSPRAQAWLRQHPECISDRRMRSKMLSAHHDAEAEGFVLDSDAYFDSIDRQLGYADGGAEERQTRVPVRPHSRALPAAPVSRDTSTSNGNLSNRVKLTPREQEMAAAMGMTNEKYAKNKLAMIKEGYYERA